MALIFYLAVAGADEPIVQYDTIVVGLGAAGVTAASTLAKAGKKVLGLEAQNRIGGRVNTVPFGDGVVELGAEWINGQYSSRVYDTAIQNNITLLSQNLAMDVYKSDGTRDNNELVKELITYCLALIEDTNTEEDSLGAYITRKLKQHLKETHPELLNDKDFLKEFLALMDLTVDNFKGSNSWNEASTKTDYRELEGDRSLSWHRYGYKTFFELLLNTYQGGPGLANLDIKLNTEVTNIVWPQQPSTPVEVTCKDGKVYRANNVIVTVSVGVLKERHMTLFTPSLPSEKVNAISRLTVGLLDKIIISFDKPWWPVSQNLFVFLWKGEDKKKVDKEDLWTTKIYAASTDMGASNTLTLWTSGDTAKWVETIPEEIVKRKAFELLQKFLGANVTIPEPTGMVRSTWYSNPYIRGTFAFDSVSSVKYPNSRADLGKPLLDSAGIAKVLFAGEALDLTHFTNVHAASESGYKEAARILASSEN
ncbi:unnamed protein product [Parnassius apollo]|uniref:(apollo) hypothetical protein n=1 Tax=Parnassius apollo TaxID=110799 RepID=A0A8S3W3U3_PARAO|nr:unnamed protein product [Parnassius apollo]